MINLTKPNYSGKSETRDVCSYGKEFMGCFGCDSSCQYTCGDACTGLATNTEDPHPCRSCGHSCSSSCTSLATSIAGK